MTAQIHVEPKLHVVRLDYSEMIHAAQAGVLRRVENIKLKTKQSNGFASGSWQADIEGAMYECAVAKGLGLYWPGKGRLRGADAGPLQVRGTEYAGGRLAVHPNDEDDAPFVLVTGRDGVYTLRGWMYGRECKRQDWWGEFKEGKNQPAFIVPTEALRPMDSLRVVLS
jgi:hypothetical protein